MTNLAETTSNLPEEKFSVNLDHTENPDVKKLLDTIVIILAEEYTQTAKQNPDIFSN